MRVLAIDASLRNTGVAIVDGVNGQPRVVFFGTIHNASALKSSSCLVAIRERLAELIREHEPDCCALEAVIYVQSYKTAILLVDEPTSHQDAAHAELVWAAIRNAATNGSACLVATHELDATGRADRWWRIQDGRLHTDAPETQGAPA